MTTIELIESKLGRCSRFIKRYQDEAKELLESDDQTSADFNDQIDITLVGMEDELSSLQKYTDDYESTIANSGAPATATQLAKLEEVAEVVFDAKRLCRKLNVLQRRWQSQIALDQLSRSVSQNTVRNVERQQNADNQSETADAPETASRSDPNSRDQSDTVSDNPTSNTDGNNTVPTAAEPNLPDSASADPDPIRLLCQTLMQMNGSQHGDGGNSLKLPKYNLPKFSGDVEKWHPFWDQFDRAVGSRPNLAGVQKLQYLLTCLEGEAEKLVAGAPLIDKNYDVVVSLLRDQYENPNRVIEKIYAKLVDLPTVPAKDCKKLREFYFDLENSMRCLEALAADSKCSHLVGVVLRKLPRYLISQLERSKGSKTQWTMQLLRDLLSEELEIEEATQLRNRTEEKQPPATHDGGKGQKAGSRSTTDAFKAQDRNDKQYGGRPNPPPQAARIPKCFFCQEGHWSGDCGKFPTADKRREFVKNSRCCFLCLSNKHAARDCHSDKQCFHCRKSRMHHSSLCPDKFTAGTRARDSGRQAGDTTDLSKQQDVGGLASDEYAVMKTAVCDAINPDDPDQVVTNVRVFMDSGTSRTWTTQDVAKRLNLKMGRKRRLLVNRFADDGEPKSIEMQEASLTLRMASGRKYKIAVAITPKTLGSISMVDRSQIKPHVPANIALADPIVQTDSNVMIDIMIGNDYYEDLVFNDRISLMPGLWLVNSAFGWLISGRASNDLQSAQRAELGMFSLPVTDTDSSIGSSVPETVTSKDRQIDDLCSLDAIGIKDEPNNITDDIALEQFNRTIQFRNGRYYVTWPYHQNADALPVNEDICLRRLQSLISRMQKQKRFDFLQKYDAVIRDQLKRGVIEEVRTSAAESDTKVHYLSHHGVEKPDRATTKIRIVYNASYRRNPDQPSLNDCLYRGQVFLESLVVLLIRFRLHPIALIGDLEKAFLKVGLQESQRDVTRFLWVKDVNKPPNDDNLVTYRFTRVSFGVKSSPFLLGATVSYHLKQQTSDVARKIERDLYVDNLVTGTDTVDEAVQLYREAKGIFASADMNIREFGSNSLNFDDQIPDVDRDSRNTVKVLGIDWDKQTDTLTTRKHRSTETRCWSKKRVLGLIHQIYDPLGLACPVVLPGKIILQEMNKKGVHWDQKLPDEIDSKWQKILSDLDYTDQIKIDRYVGFKLQQCNRMMVFCDASASAYAAVVYLQKISQADALSRPVFAKSRVSPLKKMTIPRLELLAVELGVRLINFLREHLPYSGEVILWSDSQCVLRWIPDHTVTGLFVQNRLRKIRKCKGVEFRYVPTKDNPADIATRGCAVSDLTQMWWTGPQFAVEDKGDWPHWEGNLQSLADHVDVEPANAAVTVAVETPFGISADRFSSFKRLTRVTALCLRFVSRMKGRKIESKFLTVSEIRNATLMWIKYLQSAEYPQLIADIAAKKRNSTQLELGVLMDEENFLRCHGRLALMDAKDDTKFPILLPPRSSVTQLIIADCHKCCMHGGVTQTLVALRHEFWIPRGRARVRGFVRKCTTCKRFEGKPFARPVMPELPEMRTKRSEPFCHVGLDYFGPLYTKVDRSEGTETQKRWVCILTCLCTRAVHLEMVNNLTAEKFSYAMRRFIARRRRPITIVSDNGTQFKAVEKAGLLNESLAGDAVKWKFISELTPWAGGVYERLIRSVKSAMKKSLRRVTLYDVQLQTFLTEVENCINSRPLTYLTDDINSWSVLTPNDFLGIPPQTTVSPNPDDPADDFLNRSENARDQLIKMHKAQINQMNALWHVWQNDYLLSLRESLHYGHKDPHGKVKRSPQVGEVVTVKDEKMNRAKWKLGRVLSRNVSSDGQIRSVNLQLSNGQKLTRPVNFLHPIEVDIDRTDEDDDDPDVAQPKMPITQPDPPQLDQRPRRRAAIDADQKLKILFQDEKQD